MLEEDLKEIINAQIDIAVERLFPGKELLPIFVDSIAKLEDPNKSIDLFQIAGKATYNMNYAIKEEKPKTDKEKVFNYENVLSLTEDVLRLLRHLQNICQTSNQVQEVVNERLTFYSSVNTMYKAFLNEFSNEVREAWKYIARSDTKAVRDDLYQLIGMMYKQERGVEEEAAYMLERVEKGIDTCKHYMRTVDEKKDENVYLELTRLRLYYERAKLMYEAVQKDIEKEMRAGGTW